MSVLLILPVTQNSPSVEEQSKDRKTKQLGKNALEIAPTHEDRANAFDEIGNGVDESGQIGPPGHRAYGREQATHEHQHHQEKPQDEHSLLHGLVVIGDN